jgi:GTPase involved in cell partitioning and DNA repair
MAISTDVVISLKPNGTAIYNSDIADFLSKGTATTVAGGGQGGDMNQFITLLMFQ